MNSLPQPLPQESLILLGAGGHAKVLIDALRSRGLAVQGIVDADPTRHGQQLSGVPIIGGDAAVFAMAPDTVRLINGIGSVRISPLRRHLHEGFTSRGYRFAAVVHAAAIIAPDVELSEGVQIMAGAVVQTGCRIGEGAIINTRAAVDHDCEIGRHAHISPGATLCGNVTVGEGAHVGAGATVIQGVRIGRNSMVAAGAVVIRDVPDGVSMAGVPAKEMHS